jgi:hypothetical protein
VIAVVVDGVDSHIGSPGAGHPFMDFGGAIDDLLGTSNGSPAASPHGTWNYLFCCEGTIKTPRVNKK